MDEASIRTVLLTPMSVTGCDASARRDPGRVTLEGQRRLGEIGALVRLLPLGKAALAAMMTAFGAGLVLGSYLAVYSPLRPAAAMSRCEPYRNENLHRDVGERQTGPRVLSTVSH